MTQQNTTIKSRSALAAVPTDLQNARNRLAIAIKNHTGTPNPETLQEVEEAQAEVFRLEDQYREGYRLLLAHECAKQDGGRS